MRDGKRKPASVGGLRFRNQCSIRDQFGVRALHRQSGGIENNARNLERGVSRTAQGGTDYIRHEAKEKNQCAGRTRRGSLLETLSPIESAPVPLARHEKFPLRFCFAVTFTHNF